MDKTATGRMPAFVARRCTDLHPGAYRFRVVASNDAGVWNEAGATL
jgi:hypothetical protein